MTRTYLAVFTLLVILLALSIVTAYIDLGYINPVVALAIAGTKARLVLYYFMHLRQKEANLYRVAAAAGVLFLLILIGMTLNDVLLRPEKRHHRPPLACKWFFTNTNLLRIILMMTRSCPVEVRRFLSRIGQSGGKARIKSMNQSEISASAREAITARWMKHKFGVSKFSDHALPGSEVIDVGLRDLCSGGAPSASALVVAELSPRLRQLGVPVPRRSGQIKKPRESLYRLLEREAGDGAHSKFLSLLGRADSFCASLLAWSRWEGSRAQRKGRGR